LVIRLPVPGVLAVLAVAAAGPALRAGNPRETTAVYRLRGEVRPFLFWIGRGDVGGGHITVRRTDSLPGRWSQEIEVLFGSDPARVPQHIKRWGYGRESANWTQGTGAGSGAPRLLATDFQGFMKHSAESSIDEVVPASRGSSGNLFDVTRSVDAAGRPIERPACPDRPAAALVAAVAVRRRLEDA